MNDEELMLRFENATLDNDAFHHADHVKMGFLFLCRYEATEAIHRFSTALKRITTLNGRLQRYNETVTWAFLLLIRERMARAGNPQLWDQFAVANSDLLEWENNILQNYYRAETLESELAKGTFLLPDRLNIQTGFSD